MMTEVEVDPLIGSTGLEELNAEIEVKMAGFNSKRQPLLAILRAAYDSGPKVEPFDEAKSWSRLEITAHLYFIQERAKVNAMTSADREARQRAIAEALKGASSLIDAAMRDQVGDDLFSAWYEKVNLPLRSAARNDHGSFTMTAPAEELFENTVSGLRDLETAANRAADAVHQGRGRPKGARVLPLGYIESLAARYRTSTELRPDADCSGFFVRFVAAFLLAVGRANISDEYVAKLTRQALSGASGNPSAWAPSPFAK